MSTPPIFLTDASRLLADTLARERAASDAVLRERQAQLTVALNALASIAADLKITAGPSADWVGDTMRAIRSALKDQRAAFSDIGAALGVEDEPLSAIASAAWEHAGYKLGRPSADAVRGLVALSCALTTPQAEHPDVHAACAWIAGAAGDTLKDMRPTKPPEDPKPGDRMNLIALQSTIASARMTGLERFTIGVDVAAAVARLAWRALEPTWVAEAPAAATREPIPLSFRPWRPELGEVFEGRVSGAWYRMEWLGDRDAGCRASVRLIDPGPVAGDTLEDMRPLGKVTP